MTSLAKKVFVESHDPMPSILAAMARIEAVPSGKTLIDEIPDEEWNDEAVTSWNITVGSRSVEEADELDGNPLVAA